MTLDELEPMLGVPVFATVANDFDGSSRSLQRRAAGGQLNSHSGQDFARLAGKIAGVAEPRRRNFRCLDKVF